MSVVSITGTVAAAPAAASDTTFPSGVVTIPFVQNQGGSSGKSAQRQTGPMQTSVSTGTGVYVALAGVGAAGPVTRADTLYLRTTDAMKLRLTFSNGVDSDVVSVVPVKGLHILELDSSLWLSALEVSGSGTVEWFASGQQ